MQIRTAGFICMLPMVSKHLGFQKSVQPQMHWNELSGSASSED
jgi:hypothetical protein